MNTLIYPVARDMFTPQQMWDYAAQEHVVVNVELLCATAFIKIRDKRFWSQDLVDLWRVTVADDLK